VLRYVQGHEKKNGPSSGPNLERGPHFRDYPLTGHDADTPNRRE